MFTDVRPPGRSDGGTSISETVPKGRKTAIPESGPARPTVGGPMERKPLSWHDATRLRNSHFGGACGRARKAGLVLDQRGSPACLALEQP